MSAAAFLPGSVGRTPARPPSRVLRRCACGGSGPAGECEECRNKRLRRSASAEGPGVAPAAVHDVLRSPGQPLDAGTRAYMEPRFGHSFASVRVHADGAAAESARSVGARAYAVGPDVVFGRGMYAPGSADGRRLIAHELAHVVQQSAAPAPSTVSPSLEVGPTDAPEEREADAAAEAVSAGRAVDGVRGTSSAPALRRTPGEVDPIHAPLIAEYRRAMGQGPDGVDPDTGVRVGPSDGELVHGGILDAWLRQRGTAPAATAPGAPAAVAGDVPAPATAPTLAPVASPLNVGACGTVTPGMDPVRAGDIRGCIAHARYAGLMAQSIANMGQVSSPYAPGLSAFYSQFMADVTAAGTARHPNEGGSISFPRTGLNVTVSPGVTLPVSQFTLVLEQRSGGINGAFSSGTLTLNELSGAALTGQQADVERTMYHEGFHFLSAAVIERNRQARQASPTAPLVRPELDRSLVAPFEARFTGATTPFWRSALQTASVAAADLPRLSGAYAGLQWEKVANEVLSRLEEQVYLALRGGQGFTRADADAMAQPWLTTAGYWVSLELTPAQMQAFLTSNRAAIEQSVLPVVRDIQRAYLAQRPH